LPLPKLDPDAEVAKGIGSKDGPVDLGLELETIAERSGVVGREVGRGGVGNSAIIVGLDKVTFRSGEDVPEEDLEASLSFPLPLLLLFGLVRSSPFPPREEDVLRGGVVVPATMLLFCGSFNLSRI
jgi:hypothetical protein